MQVLQLLFSGAPAVRSVQVKWLIARVTYGHFIKVSANVVARDDSKLKVRDRIHIEAEVIRSPSFGHVQVGNVAIHSGAVHISRAFALDSPVRAKHGYVSYWEEKAFRKIVLEDVELVLRSVPELCVPPAYSQSMSMPLAAAIGPRGSIDVVVHVICPVSVPRPVVMPNSSLSTDIEVQTNAVYLCCVLSRPN